MYLGRDLLLKFEVGIADIRYYYNIINMNEKYLPIYIIYIPIIKTIDNR